MTSRGTSPEESADDSTCRDHDRRICPPCLFNCQEVHLDLGAFPLGMKDGLMAYISYPYQFLFTWSEQHADLTKLDALASANKPNRYDNYTIAENAGWYPLFIPQLDEQVVGPDIWDGFRRFRFMEFGTPVPDSPDKLDTTYCKICQLTWLKGKGGVNGANDVPINELAHPRHQTLDTSVATDRYLDVRSIIVHVDGVLAKDYPADRVYAGIGVFFGEDSKYNQSESFDLKLPSKQRAELYSAQLAMEIIRNDVIGEWLGHLKRTNIDENGINHIRLIIATNSTDLTDTFTKRIDKWRWDRATHQYYKPGRKHGASDVVKNSDIIRTIYRQIEDFKKGEVGVETLWYHIDKKFNAEARDLAESVAGKPILP
ncbi:hypothetical protein Hte_008525 [Hypoxylon texense]